MAETNPEIPASPLAPLIVQLLYDIPPIVDFAQLTAKVEQYCGRTDPRHHPAPDAKLAQYFMLDAQAKHQEKSVPTSLCVSRGEAGPGAAQLETALQQTWDWDEAREIVASTKAMLIANDLIAAALDREVRNKQFRGLIRAIHEVAPCKAIHWMNNQLIVNPERFVCQQDEPEGGPLYGSINVRFFTVQGTSGDMVMDTLGLSVLGLPDIQCHYRELDPSDVAQVLRDVAYYLFQHGDVIKDGETVRGVVDSDHWRCHHEMSIVGPKRIVLDLNPGGSYAAGKRGTRGA